MTRSTFGWLGVSGGFVLVLVYVTMTSTGAPGDGGVARGGPAAAEACRMAVSRQVTAAQFPFATNLVDLGGGLYQVKGMVDERLADEVVRRNYECMVRYAGSEGYRADSVHVWQSH